jgi:putative Holliday junction resolvase
MKSKRILCLDIGQVRIGVAVTDPLGMFAQGIDVIPAGEEWMAKLDELVERYSPSVLLLGYPVRTDGNKGPEAQRIQDLAHTLEQRYPALSVTLWDERFTTTIATRALIEGGVRREKRRSKVDKLAAAIILQDYIDHLGRKL